jgi:hypothetical protein
MKENQEAASVPTEAPTKPSRGLLWWILGTIKCFLTGAGVISIFGVMFICLSYLGVLVGSSHALSAILACIIIFVVLSGIGAMILHGDDDEDD